MYCIAACDGNAMNLSVKEECALEVVGPILQTHLICRRLFDFFTLFKKAKTHHADQQFCSQFFETFKLLRVNNPELRIMASMVCTDDIIGLCKEDVTRVMLEDFLLQYLCERGFDGIEFDCKIKYTENNHAFVSLVSGLQRKLEKQNLILSLLIDAETALSDDTHEFFKTNACYFNFVILSTGKDTQAIKDFHLLYGLSRSVDFLMSYWLVQGQIPKNRLVLGVTGTSSSFQNSVKYRDGPFKHDLVSLSDGNEDVRKKVEYAGWKGIAGVSVDTLNSYKSLYVNELFKKFCGSAKRI